MITIDFLPSYAGKNDGEGASKIKGYITIESSVSDMQNGDDTEITIPFEKDYTLHVKNTEGDLKVEKISQNVQTTLGTLDYKIKVSSENGTSDVVTLKETPDQVGDDQGHPDHRSSSRRGLWSA